MIPKCTNNACTYHDRGAVDGCTHPFRPRRECSDAVMVDLVAERRMIGEYEAIRESNECWCEEEKRPGHMLCVVCYRKLPSEMQKALHRNGVELIGAYESAVALLGYWDQRPF